MEDGSKLTYEYLVVTPGCSLRFDQIEGSKEAIEDPDCPVGSIYTLNGAYKTSVLRENFKGGKALFILPTLPIKCGGMIADLVAVIGSLDVVMGEVDR